MIHSLDPPSFTLMGMEQYLVTHFKGIGTVPSSLDDMFDPLLHLSISRIMLTGTAGVAGMFMGQSISMSTVASPPQPTGLTTSLSNREQGYRSHC